MSTNNQGVSASAASVPGSAAPSGSTQGVNTAVIPPATAAAPSTPAAAPSAPQTVPYDRFAQVNKQMNQYRNDYFSLLQQVDQLQQRQQHQPPAFAPTANPYAQAWGQPPRPAAAQAPAAEADADLHDPELKALESRVARQFAALSAPLVQQVQQINEFFQHQQREQQWQRGQQVMAQIQEQHPIYADENLGPAAKIELSQRLAAEGQVRGYADIAAEVANQWENRRQAIVQSYVSQAQRSAPGTTDGAAVPATGGANGPVIQRTTPTNVKNATASYLQARPASMSRAGQV